MAIAYVDQVRHPATDNTDSDTGGSVTFTPPSVPYGAVVLVPAGYRNSTASSMSMTGSGGQVWSKAGLVQQTASALEVFWCVCNGAWSGDLTITASGGSPGGGWTVWLAGFSGVDTSIPWDVTPKLATEGITTTFVIADFNTAFDGSLALVGAHSSDNNSWSVDNSFGAVSGSGNIYWRNLASTDSSLALASKLITTAGSVGATTMTQTGVGPDNGCKWYGALRLGPAGGPVQARAWSMVIG